MKNISASWASGTIFGRPSPFFTRSGPLLQNCRRHPRHTASQGYDIIVIGEYGCTGVGSISIAVGAYETGLAPMGIRVFPNPAGLQAIIEIGDNLGSPVQMRMQNQTTYYTTSLMVR